MIKHYKLCKKKLTKLKSLDFISTNFDQVIKSIKEHREHRVRKENEKLQTRVDELDNNVIVNEQEVESIEQYLGLDMLEFHGIPVLEVEVTNQNALRVAQLVDP